MARQNGWTIFRKRSSSVSAATGRADGWQGSGRGAREPGWPRPQKKQPLQDLATHNADTNQGGTNCLNPHRNRTVSAEPDAPGTRSAALASAQNGRFPPSAEPSPLSLKTQAKTPQRNSIALNPCRTNSRWRRPASGNGGRRGTFGISTMDGSLMRLLSDIPPRPPRDIFRYRNARWRSRGDCTRGPPPGRPATPPRHG